MPQEFTIYTGQVLIPMKHSLLTRSAAITMGVMDTTGTMTTQQVVDDVAAKFKTALQANIDTNVTVGPIKIRYQAVVGTDPLSLDSTQAAWAGTNVSTTAPPNVAALVQKRTAQGGRHGRGRFYLPWVLNVGGINEAGIIATADFNALQTNVTAWLTAQTGGNVDLVVNAMYPGAPTTVPFAITSMPVQNPVATQRRRLRS